jgi:hypothetical protein
VPLGWACLYGFRNTETEPVAIENREALFSGHLGKSAEIPPRFLAIRSFPCRS